MTEEKIPDTNKNKTEQRTRSADYFRDFIPAGVIWLTGLLFLQAIDHVFVWWTLVCGWFPLYCVMIRKHPESEKKWHIANGFAIAFLIVLPLLYTLLFIFVSHNA